MDLSLKMWSAMKVLKIINIITLADAVTFYFDLWPWKVYKLGALRQAICVGNVKRKSLSAFCSLKYMPFILQAAGGGWLHRETIIFPQYKRSWEKVTTTHIVMICVRIFCQSVRHKLLKLKEKLVHDIYWNILHVINLECFKMVFDDKKYIWPILIKCTLCLACCTSSSSCVIHFSDIKHRTKEFLVHNIDDRAGCYHNKVKYNMILHRAGLWQSCVTQCEYLRKNVYWHNSVVPMVVFSMQLTEIHITAFLQENLCYIKPNNCIKDHKRLSNTLWHPLILTAYNGIHLWQTV